MFKLLWGILVNINTSRLIEHQKFRVINYS